MDLELQYFEECPSWELAAANVKHLTNEFDLSIRHQLVDTPEKATQFSFRGSPTMIVDGADLFPTQDAEVGLSCRIYQTPDGPAGSPTIDQIRAALTQRSTPT